MVHITLTEQQRATIDALNLEVVGRERKPGNFYLATDGNILTGEHIGEIVRSVVVRPKAVARVRELEAELARLKAELPEEGSWEWAMCKIVQGKTVVNSGGHGFKMNGFGELFMRANNDGKWLSIPMMQRVVPFTLHAEPPPPPTIDEFMSAWSRFHGVGGKESMDAWDELHKLAAAYRAAKGADHAARS